MKNKKAILALLLAGAMSFGVMATAGCNKVQTPGGPSDNGPNGPGEEIVVMNTDTAEVLTVGETKTLSVGEGASWQSLDTAVATVNNGVVTAHSAGVAKIKATLTSGETLTCTVIVQNQLDLGGSAPSKTPFNYNSGSVDIGSVSVEAPVSPVDPNASEYKVTFVGGSASAQYVAKNALAVEPVGVEKDGYYLNGWYTDTNYQNEYDFSTKVTAPLTLNAKWTALPAGISWVQGNFEALEVEFTGSNTTTVQYSEKGTNDWKTVDGELVRTISGSTSRVDILGLKAGRYDVKVGSTTIPDIKVNAYDRSGYAHFKNTSGVGAYKDDGTLKDNAVVIYVTEENKNTVMRSVAEKYASVTMFNIPYCADSKLENKWNNKAAESIGWWLNCAQYGMDNANSSKNKAPSNTYVGAGGNAKLGFRSVNAPIVIRIIGTVTAPEGLTDYNSIAEGGSVGDNGYMARMKNVANITIEGVGDDATIKGWGIHFMAGSDATGEQGKNFEVRNLIFDKYPEDALGMEGVQTSSEITGSVERCWVHNNVFHPGDGHTPKGGPAESDKAEGDGSCDFKRGQYFTMAYNYFHDCHKTNLIGSSDSSYQYNITFHHNMWENCGSRIPLTRQANVHFYNNYVTASAGAKTSYVHSLRANCYIFSEANYYDGSKAVTDGKSGGACKGWNNSYTANYGTNSIVDVASREQSVSNNCKHCPGKTLAGNKTDLSQFDTDSEIFYYDSTNKVSDCLLDDSTMARTRVLMYVGNQGFGEGQLNRVKANETTPSAAVNEQGSITLPAKKPGETVKNVVFTNITGTSSGTIKGKGQMITFTLTAPTEVSVTTSTTGDPAPDLYRHDGKVFAAAFTGTLTIVLGEGTYVIATGQKDKEATFTALSFADTAASSEARVNAAKAALAAIPDTVTRNDAEIIKAAGAAYGALISEDERSQVSNDLYQRYLKAAAAIDSIVVGYVIARINYIGEVTKFSGSDIDAAVKAYNELSAEAKTKVTNYATLTAAIAAFNAFADDNLIAEINRLPAVSLFEKIYDSVPAIEAMLELYENVYTEYTDLGEDAKEVDISGVVSAINTLKAKLNEKADEKAQLEALADFKKALDAITDTQNVTMDQAKAVIEAYGKMSDEKKAEFVSNEKYLAAKQKFDEVASQSKVAIFQKSKPELASSAGFTVSSDANYKGTSDKFTYDGEEYNAPLKMESKTSVTFSTSVKMKLTLYLHSGKTQDIKIDGKQYDATNGIVEIEIEAGSHTITRGSSESWLCYAILSPIV